MKVLESRRHIKSKQTHKQLNATTTETMGRGTHSKGLRQAKRQMARGKIHGKTYVAKGQRATKEMVEIRRKVNKEVALKGAQPNLAEFQERRIQWESETTAHRDSLVKETREKKDLMDDWVEWMEEEGLWEYYEGEPTYEGLLEFLKEFGVVVTVGEE